MGELRGTRFVADSIAFGLFVAVAVTFRRVHIAVFTSPQRQYVVATRCSALVCDSRVMFNVSGA